MVRLWQPHKINRQVQRNIHDSAWHTTQVDARKISFTNKAQIRAWERSYGEDSDYFRIRVRGVFPRHKVKASSYAQRWLPKRKLEKPVAQRFDPLVIGVDVARYGSDESVLVVRKGRDPRTTAAVRLRSLDTMALAGRVVELAQALRADAIFIDGGGVGGGVVDRCRLRLAVHDVQFGSKADRSDFVTEENGTRINGPKMWGAMRAWLVTGAIKADTELRDQLVGPTYAFNARVEIQLERKARYASAWRGQPGLGRRTSPDLCLPGNG